MGFNSAFKGLNPIKHFLALLAHRILHVSRISVKGLAKAFAVLILRENNRGRVSHVKSLVPDFRKHLRHIGYCTSIYYVPQGFTLISLYVIPGDCFYMSCVYTRLIQKVRTVSL